MTTDADDRAEAHRATWSMLSGLLDAANETCFIAANEDHRKALVFLAEWLVDHDCVGEAERDAVNSLLASPRDGAATL